MLSRARSLIETTLKGWEGFDAPVISVRVVPTRVNFKYFAVQRPIVGWRALQYSPAWRKYSMSVLGALGVAGVILLGVVVLTVVITVAAVKRGEAAMQAESHGADKHTRH